MLVRQRLVQTPVSSLLFRQFRIPVIVFDRTSLRPRRVSLTISLPSTLMRGVALPSRRSSLATSSVMNWPFVKIWK